MIGNLSVVIKSIKKGKPNVSNDEIQDILLFYGLEFEDADFKKSLKLIKE